MGDRVTPEDAHDWRKDRHGIDRKRPARDLWMAGLCGGIVACLGLSVIFAAQDSLLGAGTLNGCEAYPTECTAFAQERSR
ncbi:hypothetical protein [Paracoccus sp. SY]|uniref:hypothetical protein n=1 Tax=Paracoccus sp. SY TaxID=1330255 RepID=UPI000CD1E3D1|nr:hypothetical protein [Paracoccus sp. SY]